MDARVVFGVVLDRVEAGKAQRDERQMIGAPNLLHHIAARTEIAEWREPFVEDRLRCGVSFHVPTVNPSGAWRCAYAREPCNQAESAYDAAATCGRRVACSAAHASA